jgi:outer membrane lipoprotein-sorting protein
VSFPIIMRRVLLIGLWIVGAALVLRPWVLRAADADSHEAPDAKPVTWYVSTVVSGRSGYQVTHYWSSGPNLRSQTMIGIHPITTIVRGDRYWVYDELRKEGVEIKRSTLAQAEDAQGTRPFGNDLADLMQSNGEKVETGMLAGIPAEVWRATNSTGRRTIWMTVSEPRVPLRVENFDRESGESAALSYSNWTSGFELPDSAFEPPPDLRLQRFEYEQYVNESLEGQVGPAPVLYPKLLHGPRPR